MASQAVMVSIWNFFKAVHISEFPIEKMRLDIKAEAALEHKRSKAITDVTVDELYFIEFHNFQGV